MNSLTIFTSAKSVRHLERPANCKSSVTVWVPLVALGGSCTRFGLPSVVKGQLDASSRKELCEGKLLHRVALAHGDGENGGGSVIPWLFEKSPTIQTARRPLLGCRPV